MSGRTDALNMEIDDVLLDLTRFEHDIAQYTKILEGKSLDEHDME
jgi:hypothetical protein